MRKFSAAAVPVLLLGLVAPALSQIEMPESVISAGGRDIDGPSHRIRGTIGQTAIGNVVSPSYTMEIGFWREYLQLVSPVPEPDAYVWALQQNHPNPFNPRTNISYSLPEPGHVSLRIYDLRGLLVRTLVDEPRSAGEHVEVWRGQDQSGAAVSSGVYFARLVSEHGVLTRKMVLTR